jgi:hypothetical protein
MTSRKRSKTHTREFFVNKTLCNGKYKINSFEDYFLGDGAFGEVLKGKNTETNEVVAIKRIMKKKIRTQRDKTYLEREIRIMVRLKRKEQIKSMTTSS